MPTEGQSYISGPAHASSSLLATVDKLKSKCTRVRAPWIEHGGLARWTSSLGREPASLVSIRNGPWEVRNRSPAHHPTSSALATANSLRSKAGNSISPPDTHILNPNKLD